MKLKFRAEKKDFIAFLIVAIFVFFVVAICVSNVTSILNYGTPSGLNFFSTLTKNSIALTIVIWLSIVGVVFGSTSSYFFEMEKGIGFTDTPKENGYSRWAKDKEIMTAKDVVKIPFKTTKSDCGGTPVIYDKENAYVDNSNMHTLVIGATGSGKTAGVINPTMKMLMKGRESIVVTDPKGEIYEDNYKLLKDLGYQIIVLNFREPQKGSCWNPYDLPYKYQKEGNFDKANELLNDLSTNIVVDGQGQDPFWQNAAADYLTGLGLALFNDAKLEEININSINLMINQGEERFGASTYMKEYYKMQDPTSPVAINLAGTVTTADDTKAGIMTVLQQKVKTLAVTRNLSEMLSKNDFDMSSIGEKPTALFLIVQDEKTTYHSLATIFIKQCYECLISTAYKHGGSLPIRTNFLLDEFANMPKIKDISTMVTAARSRHIRFTFIIQNFAQLDKTYGKEDAQTIRGNCINTIYLLTGELSALEEISKLCGDKIVRVGKDKKEETRPLVTISELQRMKPDEYVLVRHRCPPYKGKLKMDYNSDFGFGVGATLYGKDVVYPQRDLEEVKVFSIKDFVKEKKQSAQANNNPFGSMPSGPMGGFAGMPNFGNQGMPSQGANPFGGEQDLDELIKSIDKQIAALEEEERKQKEEEAKKKEQTSEIKDATIVSEQTEPAKEEVIADLPKLEPIDKPIQIEETTPTTKVETRPVIQERENAPMVSEVVHSNMVDLGTFKMKEDNNQETDTNKEQQDNKKDDYYDDFFDDFFDE
ncbi:MAG: type IV secretory system conjugative DNA transfer family protein [Bacilli bacterium]|nr:type IV secretory system conjugative DNA transfer family protein [Bacilli bacterium]